MIEIHPGYHKLISGIESDYFLESGGINPYLYIYPQGSKCPLISHKVLIPIIKQFCARLKIHTKLNI
ncbi:hypothetical protein [Candidatus Ruthia endofausta]|uniref:hypothetical protein n=1 Tax=Candidatus Ruthia endofausta TaxID=2738852 RepID=UPI003BF5C898